MDIIDKDTAGKIMDGQHRRAALDMLFRAASREPSPYWRADMIVPALIARRAAKRIAKRKAERLARRIERLHRK